MRLICLLPNKMPLPQLSIPQLLETTVRSCILSLPRSAMAWMHPDGMPQTPKPPESKVSPDLSPEARIAEAQSG